jgi:hypothetical protein
MLLTEPPSNARNRKAHSAEVGTEKYRNHQAGKHQPKRGTRQYRGNCSLNEQGLVKCHLRDQPLGNIKQMADNVLDPVHYGDGVGAAALLEYRKVN